MKMNKTFRRLPPITLLPLLTREERLLGRKKITKKTLTLLFSFDISTTVDPGYVISLIRRLLPSDVQDGEHAVESGSIHDEPKAESRKAEAMESSGNNGELNGPEIRNDDRNRAVEKTWEECGCVLWDLAASEDHAQFMVLVIFIS
ncbi:hypothetical protein PHJA_001681900 [Phtheirospermum japonicum]|uniref:Uncharacterized protein n=1 Tax=Phtheirospermum japonicum TaxID=374723 RepID=A0A830C8A3_9LAMI|nr:hypothetical protein PHJA_001681900 [Phtheirospermum japonicum]